MAFGQKNCSPEGAAVLCSYEMHLIQHLTFRHEKKRSFSAPPYACFSMCTLALRYSYFFVLTIRSDKMEVSSVILHKLDMYYLCVFTKRSANAPRSPFLRHFAAVYLYILSLLWISVLSFYPVFKPLLDSSCSFNYCIFMQFALFVNDTEATKRHFRINFMKRQNASKMAQKSLC